MKRKFLIGVAVVVAVGVLIPAALLAARMWHSLDDADAKNGAVRALYMAQGDKCAVLVDFASQRSYLNTLDSNGRAAHLAQSMIREFRRTGDAERKGATAIQMIAVYIEGKDNYNRPDFSKRINLLKLSGTADQFRNFTDADAGDWERVKASLNAKVD